MQRTERGGCLQMSLSFKRKFTFFLSQILQFCLIEWYSFDASHPLCEGWYRFPVPTAKPLIVNGKIIANENGVTWMQKNMWHSHLRLLPLSATHDPMTPFTFCPMIINNLLGGEEGRFVLWPLPPPYAQPRENFLAVIPNSGRFHGADS